MYIYIYIYTCIAPLQKLRRARANGSVHNCARGRFVVKRDRKRERERENSDKGPSSSGS